MKKKNIVKTIFTIIFLSTIVFAIYSLIVGYDAMYYYHSIMLNGGSGEGIKYFGKNIIPYFIICIISIAICAFAILFVWKERFIISFSEKTKEDIKKEKQEAKIKKIKEKYNL